MELQLFQNKIFEVRGHRVMLDFHLAELYEVETKRLKEAVRRNIQRFPPDFMIELTQHEYNYLKDSLRSQIATSNEEGKKGGIRHMPFAFTEQGVAMLAAVLKSQKAIDVNIDIMRAFVWLRQYAMGYAELKQKLDEFMIETNAQFSDVYQALTELVNKKEEDKKPRKPIGYNNYK